MEISGVQVATGVRFLVPEGNGTPVLFHSLGGDDWCRTTVARSNLKGSFDAGDLATKNPIRCKHLTAAIEKGQWTVIEEATDG